MIQEDPSFKLGALFSLYWLLAYPHKLKYLHGTQEIRPLDWLLRIAGITEMSYSRSITQLWRFGG